MLTSLENANTNINVHYMAKNLIRSFVHTCSRKSPPPHHHHHHYHRRRQGSIARTAGRHFWGGAIGRDICPAGVAPIARGLRRTTPWMPSWWFKRCSNTQWYVSVKNPASCHIQNITSVKNNASHTVRNKITRLNGGASACTTLVQKTFLLCTKAYRCTSWTLTMDL